MYGTLDQYKCRNLFIVSVKLDFQIKFTRPPKRSLDYGCENKLVNEIYSLLINLTIILKQSDLVFIKKTTCQNSSYLNARKKSCFY